MKKNEAVFFILLGSRIKNIRKNHLRLSVEKLAEVLGVSVQQIRRYEQGLDKISLDKLAIMERKYKIPLQYFYDKQLEISAPFLKNATIPSIPAICESDEADIDKSKYKKLPVYAYTGAGRFIDLTEIEPINTIIIPIEYANNGSLEVVKVVGKSMEPIIHEGAYIGVDKNNKEFISGNIYAVYLPFEGAVIKKVFTDINNVILKSENKEFPDIIIPLKKIDRDNFIIGKVMWVLQKF